METYKASIGVGEALPVTVEGQYLALEAVRGDIYIESGGQSWPIGSNDVFKVGAAPGQVVLFRASNGAAEVEWRWSNWEMSSSSKPETVLAAQSIQDLGAEISGGLTVQVDGANVTLDAATIAGIRAAGQRVDVDSLPSVVLDAATVAGIRAAGQRVDVDSLPSVDVSTMPEVALHPDTVSALQSPAVITLAEGQTVNIGAEVALDQPTITAISSTSLAGCYTARIYWTSAQNSVAFAQIWNPVGSGKIIRLTGIEEIDGGRVEVRIPAIQEAGEAISGMAADGTGAAHVASVVVNTVQQWAGSVGYAAVIPGGSRLRDSIDIQPGSGVIIHPDTALRLFVSIRWEERDQ